MMKKGKKNHAQLVIKPMPFKWKGKKKKVGKNERKNDIMQKERKYGEKKDLKSRRKKVE